MVKKIKKIVLINPKKPLKEQNPKAYELFEKNKAYLKQWYAAPLNLLIIASHTRPDIEVTLIDEHFEKIDFNQKYDLVGLTAMTQQANRAYEIAKIFKEKKIPVVLGGIHASILPDEALQHVDTVFVGEAEELWKQFLVDFENGKSKRIYTNEVPYNLSNSVTPRYDLINYNQFKENTSYYKFIPVQATRGCPHDCSFCVVSKYYGKKIRKKAVKQVVEDIKCFQSLNMDSLIMFTDDNLFVDKKYAKELLKELIPLKIKYFAQSDVKVAEDQELLDLAYQSGCQIIFIGFESIETESLFGLNTNNWKMKQVGNYKKAINTILNHGITAFGAFIIGLKNDSTKTFEQIKEFVIENNIPGQFTLLTPMPGTREYDRLKQENLLFSNTFWDQCSCMDMTFHHPHLSKEDAENKLNWLYDEVYNEENMLKRNLHMIQIYKKLPPRWNQENKI